MQQQQQFRQKREREQKSTDGKTFLSHFTLINDNSNQLLVATVHARKNCVTIEGEHKVVWSKLNSQLERRKKLTEALNRILLPLLPSFGRPAARVWRKKVSVIVKVP